MTQEDKMLLIKDLSARLPYAVIVEHTSGFRGTLHDITVHHMYDENDNVYDAVCYTNFFGDEDNISIECFKPYLFPLSSMTEEQRQEYTYIVNYISPDDTDNWKEGEFIYVEQFAQLMHFYHINHLDYMGLIEKELSIDATGLNVY